MNTLPSSDVRWDVLQDLYSRLQKLTPGTKEAEIAEHAISLALNPRRQSKDATFFLYDVLDNAKHSILRTQTRRNALLKKFTAYSAHVVHNYETPEAICIAQEIEAKIREAAGKLGPNIVRCLDGMLVGESVSQTAAACGISRRSVDRARQKIREILRPMLSGQETEGWQEK